MNAEVIPKVRPNRLATLQGTRHRKDGQTRFLRPQSRQAPCSASPFLPSQFRLRARAAGHSLPLHPHRSSLLPDLGFPMAAAVAAPSKAGIPRGRLVVLSVLFAFLLGALWLANGRSIAKALAHCLAVECSVLDDDKCFVWLKWSLPVFMASLMFTLATRHGESVTRAHQAAGGSPSDLLDGKLADGLAFFALYFLCAMIFLAAKAIQHVGALVAARDPADELGAHLLKMAPIYYDAGFLALSIVHCCFTIPYMLIRLMWFLVDNCVSSLSA
ncbi:hypothetical protein EJB05_49164, partial [Eragrostis curvula]